MEMGKASISTSAQTAAKLRVTRREKPRRPLLGGPRSGGRFDTGADRLSVGAGRAEQHRQGADQRTQIEQRRAMLDVIQVVLRPALLGLQISGVASRHP